MIPRESGDVRDIRAPSPSAIRDDDPVLVIENLPIYKEKGEVPDDPEFLTPIGEANVAREGSDLTIVSHSFATVRALHVAERLAAEHDARAAVIDLRSLRPLDMETVAASVAGTAQRGQDPRRSARHPRIAAQTHAARRITTAAV